MPRRRSAPRLYLDKSRNAYVLRDGSRFIRLGPSLADAEKQLADYIGTKHQPQRGSDPLIADVLLVYDREHLQHTASARDGGYRIGFLGRWWGAYTVSEITPARCREYRDHRQSDSGARKDLECLRSSVNYWHRHRGPLGTLPAIILPPKEQPRERWLTRSEAARLLWAARRTDHLKRFILLGLYTGSRSKNILGLRWGQVNLVSGVLSRLGEGEIGSRTKRAPPVRLGGRLLSHMRRWKRLDGAAEHVIHFEGRPVARVNKSNGSFRVAVSKAGLSGVTPHTLRHTAATWLMQRGVSIWEASGFLGMSPEVLTKRYSHHSPDYQRDAAEALSRK